MVTKKDLEKDGWRISDEGFDYLIGQFDDEPTYQVGFFSKIFELKSDVFLIKILMEDMIKIKISGFESFGIRFRFATFWRIGNFGQMAGQTCRPSSKSKKCFCSENKSISATKNDSCHNHRR